MANLKLIEAKTLTTTTANVTFSSIPQTYTDLKLVMSIRTTQAGIAEPLIIGFNGSTTGYTGRQITGEGGTIDNSTYTQRAGNVNGDTSTSNTFANIEVYIPNYTSSNYKSYSNDSVTEGNSTTAYASLNAGLWSNTAAITSIELNPLYQSFKQYCTFYLYGISNVTTGSKATGGIISFDSSYYYHTFPHSGTFTPTESLTADVLVIAGGGGGGSGGGAGGGAGGYRSSTGLSLTAQAYTVTVGAGGARQPGSNLEGNDGSNSVFSTITSTGGGGGGCYEGTVGRNGGSGGGGGGKANAGTAAGGTGIAGQGNNGGAAQQTGDYAGGGGGGAGSVGGTASGPYGGNGGDGLNTHSSWATATGTGVSGYYAGGGGGSKNTNPEPGIGGLGGGGNGSVASTRMTDGVANTGGGGGGANNTNGRAGGSGLVIIRYAI